MRRLPLLFLLGCTTGATVTEDTGVDPGSDTGTTDSGDTGEDSGDTGTTGVVGGRFELRFDQAPASSWRIGAYLTQFDSTGFVHIREDYSVAATGFPQQVDALIPGAGDLVDYDGTGSAFWVWFLYDDADGSGGFGASETIVATGSRMLAYADAFQGQSDVFYAMGFTAQGAEYFLAQDGFDLVDLGGADSITLAGTTNWTGNPNGAPDRAATFTSAEFQGQILANRPLDVALDASFEWTLSGPVDPGRVIVEQGYSYALEVPLGYHDADGSGDFTTGDALASTLCRGGDPVYLLWGPPPEGIEAAAIAGLYGLTGGWSAWATTAAGEEQLVDTTGLTLSPTDCSFQ